MTTLLQHATWTLDHAKPDELREIMDSMDPEALERFRTELDAETLRRAGTPGKPLNRGYLRVDQSAWCGTIAELHLTLSGGDHVVGLIEGEIVTGNPLVAAGLLREQLAQALFDTNELAEAIESQIQPTEPTP